MTKKVTITLPERTIEMLEKVTDNKSGFIAQAVEEKISEVNIRKSIAKAQNPFVRFAKLRDQMPKYSTEEIMGFIDKGRA